MAMHEQRLGGIPSLKELRDEKALSVENVIEDQGLA